MLNSFHYQKTLSQIESTLGFFQEVDNDNEMNRAYIDEYTTSQQRKRDKTISELLQEYVDAYKRKNRSNFWFKLTLLGLCVLIISAFSVVFIILLMNFKDSTETASMASVAELISVCITFLTLIVGILTIITKYVFPENEEEYITRIVEIIQKNDLENKKENIKAKSATQIVHEGSIDFKEIGE